MRFEETFDLEKIIDFRSTTERKRSRNRLRVIIVEGIGIGG